jgi:uncharacterized Zn-finger protein
MEQGEVVYVKERVVACDGGKLGHPRVYLNLGPKGEVECPYCSRRFVLESPPAKAAS